MSRETLCEEDFDDLQEEAPLTGAGSRTGRPSVGANVTPKKLDLSDAKPKDEAGRTCFSGGKLIVAVGLLAVLAYFLLADEEGQLMLPEPGRAPALRAPELLVRTCSFVFSFWDLAPPPKLLFWYPNPHESDDTTHSKSMLCCGDTLIYSTSGIQAQQKSGSPRLRLH